VKSRESAFEFYGWPDYKFFVPWVGLANLFGTDGTTGLRSLHSFRLECVPQRFKMTTNVARWHDEEVSLTGHSRAANGLALVRVTIGAMFVWVFFENLGKGLYTPNGYAGLIRHYIETSHSPGIWKAVMGLAANHAAMAAPMQGITEISLGILLVIGLVTRPAAFVAFLLLGSLWMSELGTSWIWELLVPVLASLGLFIGRAGRAWGVDAVLARRNPTSQWW
jgi:uncharacterized membrane protein YphA (DoxX/SURF4 family)